MASITVTLPDAVALQLVGDIAKIRGDNISGFTTPQKIAYIKNDLRNYWLDCMVNVEAPVAAQTAADQARATTIANIQSALIVT